MQDRNVRIAVCHSDDLVREKIASMLAAWFVSAGYSRTMMLDGSGVPAPVGMPTTRMLVPDMAGQTNSIIEVSPAYWPFPHFQKLQHEEFTEDMWRVEVAAKRVNYGYGRWVNEQLSAKMDAQWAKEQKEKK